MPPLDLKPGHTYLRVTTRAPADITTNELAYVGRVGELDDEHVFEVVNTGNTAGIQGDQASAPADLTARAGQVVQRLQGQGVSAELLVARQRTKRDEF
jgi:hypothetical protein